jgi:Glycosyltransferases involved in cell wall biogenesis
MSLSVVIPVYNSEEYLSRLLRLIENQTEFVDKIIFVDDGSSDQSYHILTEWSNKIEIAEVYRGDNQGAAAARQTGLEHVVSEHVTFIDSDDVIAEDYFENIEKIISLNKNFDMYVLSYTTYFSEKKVLNRTNYACAYLNGRNYAESIYNGRTIGDAALWNHIYSVEFIRSNAIGFDLSAGIAEDCLFNDLCILNANSVFVSDYNGYTWMCDHDSLTGRCPMNMGETLKKHIDYSEAICKKYGIPYQFVFDRKKWAFTYLIHNILYSGHQAKTKDRLFEKAIRNNMDAELIEKMFSGTEKIFLRKTYRTGNFRYYVWYQKYNWKTIKGYIFSALGKAKRNLRINAEKDI